LSKTYTVFRLKQIESMVYFFVGARPCSFRQCVTFHPNNLVHLHLCQRWHCAKVGSICRMQLRPSDMGVGRFFFQGGNERIFPTFF